MKKIGRRIGKYPTKKETRPVRNFDSISPEINSFDDTEYQEKFNEIRGIIKTEQEEIDEDEFEKLNIQHEEDQISITLSNKKDSVPHVNLGSKQIQVARSGLIPHAEQSFKKDSLSLAIHDLLHLENNTDYLSDEKLKEWGEISKKAKRFERILTLLTVELDLPATKDLTQGQYFDKFFGWPDYVVSKILKTAYTLMFLYCGVRSVEDLENISDLQHIGDENDYTVSKYTDLISNHSEEHALKVFNMCNELTANKSSLRKVTGTLVENASETILQEKKLLESISDGASDEYSLVKFSCTNKSTEEHTNEQGDVKESTDKIKALVSRLNDDYSHIKDIVNNIENYASQDLKVILDLIDDLNHLKKSLRKPT